MIKINEFVEQISSNKNDEDITNQYLKILEIDEIYKCHLGKSFKNIIKNYRDNKIEEMCRDFIICVETLLNYHIGENLKYYKKLCRNYENQFIEYICKIGKSEYESKYVLAIKNLIENDILNYNYIDDKFFSFHKKLNLFLIFNFANHHHILDSTICYYRARNVICHGFQNPNFCRYEKKKYNIKKSNIKSTLNEILNIISYCSTAVNRKGYLKKLLQVSPEKIKGNKYLLTITLKKDHIKALNKDIKNKEKMKKVEKDKLELLKKLAKHPLNKEISVDDIGKEILDEMNIQSGRISLDDIGKETLDEMNIQSGRISLDDIGKEILDEINFHSGVLDSNEIEEIFKKINSNIQKIDTDDLIDIIYEIGEAEKS